MRWSSLLRSSSLNSRESTEPETPFSLSSRAIDRSDLISAAASGYLPASPSRSVSPRSIAWRHSSSAWASCNSSTAPGRSPVGTRLSFAFIATTVPIRRKECQVMGTPVLLINRRQTCRVCGKPAAARRSAPRHGGHDADLIAGLQGGRHSGQEADVLPVHVDVHEPPQLPHLVAQPLLQAGVLPLKRLDAGRQGAAVPADDA